MKDIQGISMESSSRVLMSTCCTLQFHVDYQTHQGSSSLEQLGSSPICVGSNAQPFSAAKCPARSARQMGAWNLRSNMLGAKIEVRWVCSMYKKMSGCS